MKRFIQLLILTFVILIVAIAAAPFFVRQEQLQSFIEKRVVLPDNQKLKLEGKIKFGFFPYMHVKVPQASIIDKNGNATMCEDFSFGFNFSDLFGSSMGFDTGFTYLGNEYKGNFFIEDYNGFLNKGQSPVVFKLEKPLPMTIKGDLIHQENFYSLRDFVITHKQTTATGTLKIHNLPEGGIQIDLNSEINSDDIENLRRIAQFGKNNDDFNLLSGTGKMKLNVTTKGKTPDEFKANLNGDGDLTVTNAAIYGVNLNEIIGSPQETVLTHNTDRKIDIKEADSTFKIVNGIVKIDKLTANNQFANITGSGQVDIPQSSLRIGLDVDADIASAQVKIPLLVYGTFDKVKFAPRTGDAIMGNIDNITDLSKIKFKNVKIKLDKGNLKESVKQLKDIGKSLGINLGKALKEPKEPAAPAAPLAPASAPDSTPATTPEAAPITTQDQ